MEKLAYGGIVARFNEKYFFLTYLWGTNFWRFLISKMRIFLGLKEKFRNPIYPKSQLFLVFGSLGGVVISIFLSIVFFLVLLAIACFMIAEIIIGSLLGFIVDLRKGSDIPFHPYLRYGWYDEKKLPIAPWWIWLPILILWLFVMKDFLILRSIADFFVWFFEATSIVASKKIVVMSAGAVIVLIPLLLFFPPKIWSSKDDKR